MSDTYDPLKTDEPQALKNRAGDPRPVYDQYEVNQPHSINKLGLSVEQYDAEHGERGERAAEPETLGEAAD